MMLGWMFYLFKKYGDTIAQSYQWENGCLEMEVDMSGRFGGYYGGQFTTTIFNFDSVDEAIKMFRKEIERLDNG